MRVFFMHSQLMYAHGWYHAQLKLHYSEITGARGAFPFRSVLLTLGISIFTIPSFIGNANKCYDHHLLGLGYIVTYRGLTHSRNISSTSHLACSLYTILKELRNPRLSFRLCYYVVFFFFLFCS